jgi:C-terminal processing protease CtpA/Prc
VVHLKRKGAESVGISIRGGLEYNCGVYISSVQPSSRAAQVGLKVGDEIVRINGMSIHQSTSVEVVNLLKMKKSLALTCKSVGMLPQHDPASGGIVWKDINDKSSTMRSRLTSEAPSGVQSTKKLQLLVDGSSLGISIQTKLNSRKGVAIREVVPNSPADNAGLKPGDEITQVDEHSVVGVSHEKAIELLTSKDSLMLTLKVDPTQATPNRTSLGGSSIMGMFTDPPDTFELKPNEFDIDSEITPDVQLHYKEAFLLKAREGEEEGEESPKTKESKPDPKYDRLSVLEMEADPTKGIPSIAFSSSFGFGPTFALPTLQSFPQEEQDGDVPKPQGTVPNASETVPQLQSSQGSAGLDASLISVPGFTSPDREHSDQGSTVRQSTAIDMGNFTKIPPSVAEVDTTVSQNVPENPPQIPTPVATPPTETTDSNTKEEQPQVDLSPFQIPSSDESENEDADAKVQPTSPTSKPVPAFFPDLSRKPQHSAMKKPSISGVQQLEPPKRKTSKLGFRESVEFIDERYSVASSGGSIPEDGSQIVHPSNMEFSEEVLKGRKVVFHTVPKTGPLMVGIRGGMDTGEDEQGVYISTIREGGAAYRYGRLHVGDQILVVDGFSLLNVAHQDAVLSLQKAMNMESTSIDLVVAVPKGLQEEETVSKDKTSTEEEEEEEETDSSSEEESEQ